MISFSHTNHCASVLSAATYQLDDSSIKNQPPCASMSPSPPFQFILPLSSLRKTLKTLTQTVFPFCSQPSRTLRMKNDPSAFHSRHKKDLRFPASSQLSSISKPLHMVVPLPGTLPDSIILAVRPTQPLEASIGSFIFFYLLMSIDSVVMFSFSLYS